MITLKNITDGLRMATKYRYNQMLEPTNRENKKVLEDAENICTSLPDIPGYGVEPSVTISQSRTLH